MEAAAAVQVELANRDQLALMVALVWQAQLPDLQFITVAVAVVLDTVRELAALVVMAVEVLEPLIQLMDLLGLMVWVEEEALVQMALRLAAAAMVVRAW